MPDNQQTPKVGDGATICIGSDRYPATVERVSASGKTVWLREDKAVGDTENGHNYFGNQVWLVTPDPEGRSWKAIQWEHGWKVSPSDCWLPVFFGHRRKYSDPSF